MAISTSDSRRGTSSSLLFVSRSSLSRRGEAGTIVGLQLSESVGRMLLYKCC